MLCSRSRQAPSQHKQPGETSSVFRKFIYKFVYLKNKIKIKSRTTTKAQFACRIISNKNPSTHKMVLVSPVPGLLNQCSKPKPWNQRERSLKNEPDVAESSIALLASRNPRKLYMWLLHVQRKPKEFHYERKIRWKFLILSHKQYRNKFKIFCFKHAFNLCSGNQIMLLR